MQQETLSRQVTISDPRAAAVFTDSHLRRILLQFAGPPRGMAEVANELALDIKRLHHAVTKLHRLGLVEAVEERQRAGRSIKLYQCSGSSYFIPSSAAPVPFSRGLAKELQSAIERDAAATIEGIVFYLDAAGRVSGQWVEKPAARQAPLDSWRILRLNPAQARDLKRELGEVLDRYQKLADASGTVYLVHTGMARRLEQNGATDNAAP
jgi:hypothetical protein